MDMSSVLSGVRQGLPASKGGNTVDAVAARHIESKVEVRGFCRERERPSGMSKAGVGPTARSF